MVEFGLPELGRREQLLALGLILLLVSFVVVWSVMTNPVLAFRLLQFFGGAEPEPGTPYKWLGVRISYNQYWFRDQERSNFDDLMQLRPSIIQYVTFGEWWYFDPDINDLTMWKWNVYTKPSILNLLTWCYDEGIYLSLIWANADRADIGFTNNNSDPRCHFLTFLDDFFAEVVSTKGAEYLPLWFGISTEYSRSNSTTVEGKRAELNAVKAVCEKYGVRFFVSTPYKSARWDVEVSDALADEYPIQPGTNYPLTYWGETADKILIVDDYASGFGIKTGICTVESYDDKYIWDYWTEQSIINQFDYVDQANNLGIYWPDVMPEMLDPALCPDFVPTILQEAPARGYVMTGGLPSPPISHMLTVNSTLQNTPFLINGIQKTTFYSESLTEGSYTIDPPSNIQVGPDTYNFKEWEDLSTNPLRTFSLTSAMDLFMTYELQPPPPPDKGYVEVHAFVDSEEVTADGVIVENSQTFTTPDTLEVDAGTYTVQVTYGGNPDEKTVTVGEGETVRVDFQFGPAPSGGGGGGGGRIRATPTEEEQIEKPEPRPLELWEQIPIVREIGRGLQGIGAEISKAVEATPILRDIKAVFDGFWQAGRDRGMW